MENNRKHRNMKLTTTEKKEAIWYQNQIIILKSFSQKCVGYRNEKNSNTHE